MTLQGTVKATTHGGADASLLDQHLGGRLYLVESLQTDARESLAAIPSVDEALRKLGTFTFTASHLFSAGGRHSSAVAELPCLIENLEDLHTEVQGIISYSYLSMTVIYDVLRLWSFYLNRCMAASDSKALEALGANAPFLLEPILIDIEGARYVGPILTGPLEDLLTI